MAQLYQDSMALVRKAGKPDLFITITCNPRWSEIANNSHGQSAVNRPDIVARVFQMKLKEILKDILKNGVFGRVAAHLAVIEFQKRGLPHAHCLFILHREDKPRVS